MDKTIDDATWEQEHTLNALFPHFMLQEYVGDEVVNVEIETKFRY